MAVVLSDPMVAITPIEETRRVEKFLWKNVKCFVGDRHEEADQLSAMNVKAVSKEGSHGG